MPELNPQDIINTMNNVISGLRAANGDATQSLAAIADALDPPEVIVPERGPIQPFTVNYQASPVNVSFDGTGNVLASSGAINLQAVASPPYEPSQEEIEAAERLVAEEAAYEEEMERERERQIAEDVAARTMREEDPNHNPNVYIGNLRYDPPPVNAHRPRIHGNLDGGPKKQKKPMPQIKDRDIIIVAQPQDSVEDMLLKAFTFMPIRLPCHFHFREVAREDCFSAEHGREMSCWQWTIDSESIARLATYVDKNGQIVSNVFYVQAANMEPHIGVPALPFIGKPLMDKLAAANKTRPLDEIMARLVRYRKKATKELKDLRQIYPDIDEPQSPKLLGAIGILSWMFNGGNNIAFDVAINKLRSLIIAREREKLFYVIRHPDNPVMHKAQDLEVIEAINQMEWFFYDINPLANVPCYGRSTYRS